MRDRVKKKRLYSHKKLSVQKRCKCKEVIYKKKNNEVRIAFSTNEDNFLHQFLDENPDFKDEKALKIRGLEGNMNRSFCSVRERIYKLQSDVIPKLCHKSRQTS